MPRGPKGERRPADVIGKAVHVMRIAIGEIKDKVPSPEGRRPYDRSGSTSEKMNLPSILMKYRDITVSHSCGLSPRCRDRTWLRWPRCWST
jgi:hypothetical protein